jgi:RimJ/RimL family protein N-acetyltransferase
MLKYKCLVNESINSGTITLRTVQLDEIQKIRVWRNSQKVVLRQSLDITIDEQDKYFEEFVWKFLDSPTPNQILLGIHTEGNFIGYGGLVHISHENLRAEVSFLLDPQIDENSYEYEQLFKSFLEGIEKIAIDSLRLHKIFTETYEFRSKPIKIIEQSGFVREKIFTDHVLVNGKWFSSIMHGKDLI